MEGRNYWYNHGLCHINLVHFFSIKTMGNNENPFWVLFGKIPPLILNHPVSFVLGSARCSLALTRCACLCEYPFKLLNYLFRPKLSLFPQLLCWGDDRLWQGTCCTDTNTGGVSFTEG